MADKSPKLTKAEIIDALVEKCELNRRDIHNLVDLFLDELKDAMVHDRIVELRGFGTFEIHERKGRDRARNPKTGEKVSVHDHCVAVFRPGKELKQVVWGIHSEKDNEE